MKTTVPVLLGESSEGSEWVSAHKDVTCRFALKSQRFDRAQFVKRLDGKLYFYCSDLGVSARVGKTHVFFTVFGVRARSVRGVFRNALPLVSRALRRVSRVAGVRVRGGGEWVGLPHFVVADKRLSKWLKKSLGLQAFSPKRRVAGVDWWLDGSHPGLVEFAGGKERVAGVGDEVEWLLDGGMRRLLTEVRGLRRDLRFKPSGAPRIEVG